MGLPEPAALHLAFDADTGACPDAPPDLPDLFEDAPDDPAFDAIRSAIARYERGMRAAPSDDARERVVDALAPAASSRRRTSADTPAAQRRAATNTVADDADVPAPILRAVEARTRADARADQATQARIAM